MHEFLHENPFIHALYHSLLVLPLLFLAYLLMEWFEHKASMRLRSALVAKRQVGPALGSVLGLIPLCGLADFATGLYAGKFITIGTLFAILLSTSGEAIFLVASYPDKLLDFIFLLLLKVVIACIGGFVIDFILRKKQSNICIEKLCEEKHCQCEHGILISAIRHTLPVFLSVCLFNFALALLEVLGVMSAIVYVIGSYPAIGVILAAFIGLVPGCAPLVTLVGLWGTGLLSSSALLAGLISSAGTGLVVLFRTNKAMKQNFALLGYLLLVALFVGTFFEFTGLLSIFKV